MGFHEGSIECGRGIVKCAESQNDWWQNDSEKGTGIILPSMILQEFPVFLIS
jgi:hypothetical protein